MTEEKHQPVLKTGDIRLFEEIYSTYFPVLYNYAVSIIKKEPDAEDAVSEVFLKLWERRNETVIGSSLKAYLFKSVYHQCLNMLKHARVRDTYRDFFLFHSPLNESGTDYPLSDIIENEIGTILQKTIDRLPEKCRKIFIMSQIDGMKHKEISKGLGVTVNTVRTQIRRALRRLYIELKYFFPDMI